MEDVLWSMDHQVHKKLVSVFSGILYHGWCGCRILVQYNYIELFCDMKGGTGGRSMGCMKQ